MYYYEKMIFVSSRTRRSEQGNRENRTSSSIQISVPCELVMGHLSQGGILQLQIGPVPLRPDLARPGPRPERPEPTNPRPEAEMSNIGPNVADDSSRPNPSGRSEKDVPRTERPISRHPPIRPVSLSQTGHPYQTMQKWFLFLVRMMTMCLEVQNMRQIPQDLLWNQRTKIQDQMTMNLVLLGGLYFQLYPGCQWREIQISSWQRNPHAEGFPFLRGIG